ncbi:transposase [Leptothermofonsia sichuanensis E412]|nr:transposase [Leptothermofonsia sichuanensis E412]
MLPKPSPKGGRPANDHRTTINGILWMLRTGAPWRDLPDRYGAWQTVAGRF